MGVYTFVLATETKDVSVADLYRLKFALEINAAHCADAWGKERPAVDVIDDRRNLPRGCHPIVFLDDGGNPNTLAHHYWDPVRQGPAARVFVDKASGFNKGRFSVAEAASHEVVEALIDPQINLWVDHPHPDAPEDWQMAVEVADFVQTHYGVKAAGEDWRMSNFVTPAYFNAMLGKAPQADRDAFFKAGGKLDFSGELKMPGEIGPEGYAILRTPKDGGGWKRFTKDARGQERAFDKLDAKAHPWARTNLRGVRVT